MAIELGAGMEINERAVTALRRWKVHVGAGVYVTPSQPELIVGVTVGLVTRQCGLWILAACRITSVVDSDSSFGFTYATLPDHPECGEETFLVTMAPDGVVKFEISATWRSGTLIARVGEPVSRVLQRRATAGYLNAMVRSCSTD